MNNSKSIHAIANKNINHTINSGEVAKYYTKRYIDCFLTGVIPTATPITNYLDLPELGSHLIVPRTGYTHHGIYVENKMVVHYSGLADRFESGHVEEVSFVKFCGGKTCKIKLHPNSIYDPQEIRRRACSRIGEQDYSIVFNNCEHFVHWCIYNTCTSQQVGGVVKTGVHAGLKAIGRSNFISVSVAALAYTAQHIKAYIDGDITKEKLFDEISHTAITTTSTCYYAGLGQAVIPIPVVGALVGASVGFFIGNMLQRSGLIALGDSQIVKAAKKRRQEIETICSKLIPEIKKSRTQLENYIEKYFSDRKQNFIRSFDLLDSSLENWDSDLFVSALNTINNQFGETLQFKTFEEFDSFMKTDEALDF